VTSYAVLFDDGSILLPLALACPVLRQSCDACRKEACNAGAPNAELGATGLEVKRKTEHAEAGRSWARARQRLGCDCSLPGAIGRVGVKRLHMCEIRSVPAAFLVCGASQGCG
jgi:hypothetical protein